MGTTRNFKTHSDEYGTDYGKYITEVKNIRRGSRKKVAKHKEYQAWEEDSY